MKFKYYTLKQIEKEERRSRMITGKKVIIRQFELGDEEFLYKWWNDGKMMEHSGLAFGTLQSKEFIKNKVVNEVNNGSICKNDKKCFMICKKENLIPIGEINYNSYDSRNQKAEFGIKICEENEQGKGYGEDALTHFIDFMFKNLNLNKIELTTMIDNIRAQSMYKKLGFKEIGVIRKAYFDSRYGDFSDVIYMDLLKDEWNKKDKNIKTIEISESLRLMKLGKYEWDIALPWYQDKDILYYSEGVINKVYDLEAINKMYSYLQSQGELYFIQVLENGVYKTIGDVALSENNMPIVIGDKSYWGRGIGKKAILTLIDRAKKIKIKSIKVEIYKYNKRSQKLFTSVGFKEIEENEKSKIYKMYL